MNVTSQDSDYDALHLAKAAKLIRDDIFKLSATVFQGNIPSRSAKKILYQHL